MKLIVLSTLLLSLNLFAKRFSTEYLEFELPSGWECILEGAEWVCQSDNKNRKKEAIIIMAAKEKGPQDSLESYTTYLTEKKEYLLPNRKKQISEPRYTKIKTVNQSKWVDSLHLASEVPGFYTRYLATVKGELGVAVTFSVSKDHYDAYQAVFDKVISSMRVFSIQKGSVAKYKLRNKKQNLLEQSIPVGEILTGPAVVQQKTQEKKSSGGTEDLIFYALLALAVGGFIIYKKKKGQS